MVSRGTLLFFCLSTKHTDHASSLCTAGLRKRLAPATVANAQISSSGSFPSNALTYGAHLAVSLSIGFLFMAAGSMTFNTSAESGAVSC